MAIRYGSQTVDPVTGSLGPVVGARLDASRKTVVPVTASYWLTMADQTDSVQVGKQLKHMFLLIHFDLITPNMALLEAIPVTGGEAENTNATGYESPFTFTLKLKGNSESLIVLNKHRFWNERPSVPA